MNFDPAAIARDVVVSLGQPDEAPWSAPSLDLATADTLPPPPLPLVEVFPEKWATWIENAAEAKGAPPDFVAVALLSVAGALIGNARWSAPWDDWKEPPVINAALVGNPSSGKSPALDALIDPLSKIQNTLDEDWPERQREHKRATVEAKLRAERWEVECKEAVKHGNAAPLPPAGADNPTQPQHRRIFSTDPTVAKAERMAAGNPRGLLLQRDELAGWIAGMDRFNGGGSSDRAFWLQAYGGRPWAPDRVKDGDNEISVPHLTWSLVGGIQPDRLASLLLTGDDDGLSARFLYTWPAPRPPNRPRARLDVGRATAWLDRLRALPWTPPEPLPVPFTSGAQEALQAWREEIASKEAAASGLFLSWQGKLPGFAIRLALVFAHLDWCSGGSGDPPGEVREADMARALDFPEDYAAPMARRCFGEAALPEAERDARRLARWLRRQTSVPAIVNARALRRMTDGPGIGNPARIEAALEELAALGCVRRNASGGGGHRPRGDWSVNPALIGGGHGLA